MTLVTTGLSVTGAGQIDLFQEEMIVDYTGPSPIEHVRQRVGSGYNGGAWNGTGIVSSNAAAGSTTAVGYAESSDLFTSFPATFAGQSVDSTAVLLKYTYYGDANLDGNVNLNDFGRLAANFGQTNRRWSQGNFDFDNDVDLADFGKLAATFGRGGLAPEARPSLEERLLHGEALTETN
jgi:hypothetical protein